MRPLLLVVFCLYGCTSLRPVEPGAVSAVIAELRVGDRIAVRTADGWHDKLTVTAVTDTEFEAAAGGAPLTIRREEVLEINVPRDAPAKTAGLAIGLMYGALLGLFLLSDYD